MARRCARPRKPRHAAGRVRFGRFRAARRGLIDLGPDKALKTLTTKSPGDVEERQTECKLKRMRASGSSDEERALTGVETIVNHDETIAAVSPSLNISCVAVIPEGPCALPFSDVAAYGAGLK
jgi:hypothetical protein